MASSKSFYGRELPDVLVDYRSNESKSRLTRCLINGTAVPFLSLSSCFSTQTEPAYCGVSTLAIVLNALRIDPQRIWKTPWRWFTEELLDCCRPLEVVKKVGITMEEFSCLAKCNGAVCTMTRPDGSDKSYDLFRKAVQCVCSGGTILQKELNSESPECKGQEHHKNVGCCSFNENVTDMINQNMEQEESFIDKENPNEFITISYSRKVLKQTGSGHFSPVAAYDLETDSVLVLDTARFKYPPYWVSIRLLYESMLPVDEVTGKGRGYFVVRAKHDVQGRRVCCVWRELLAITQGSDGSLPEPHPMYDKNITCCREASCSSGKEKCLLSGSKY